MRRRIQKQLILGSASLVWAGDIGSVIRNRDFSRWPAFYGLTIGWVAIGLTAFDRLEAVANMRTKPPAPEEEK